MIFFSHLKSAMQHYQANSIFTNMLRKKLKQLLYFVVFCTFVYSFYCCIYVSQGSYLWNIENCPVCYGFTACDKLFANQLVVNGGRLPGIISKQTVFYGTNLYGVKVVFKRLASERQFKELDANLCKIFDLKFNCKPSDTAVESLLAPRVLDRVNPDKLKATGPVKGLVMCPNAKTIHDMIDPFVHKTSPRYEHDMINIWTMLTLNPEPIMLQVLPKADGWPVPTYGGVCGRLEIVTYEGQPISTVLDYRLKLKLARTIIDAALLLTYKHDRYRFYLLDWSLENIVYNEQEEISFVDLEDVVILDKTVEDTSSLPNWLSENGISNKLGTTLHNNLCTHHLSDHNIWAVCNLLAGGDNPFLYPVPDIVNKTKPNMDRFLQDCLHNANGTSRFQLAHRLKHVIFDIVAAGIL